MGYETPAEEKKIQGQVMKEQYALSEARSKAGGGGSTGCVVLLAAISTVALIVVYGLARFQLG